MSFAAACAQASRERKRPEEERLARRWFLRSLMLRKPFANRSKRSHRLLHCLLLVADPYFGS
jgi:hypothetical protein